MNTGALVGHIEAYTVVRAWEVRMKQVNAGQPTVVMADDGRTLAVNEVRHFVPDPRLRDLNRCERVGGHGQEPIEGFNHDQRQWNSAIPRPSSPTSFHDRSPSGRVVVVAAMDGEFRWSL